MATRSYQFVIAGDPITLGPASLPDALGNQPYSAQLTASGGTAPYTFTMPSATNWAAGMVVNPDGTITGTPPAGTTGLLSFTVQATDANGSTSVRVFQINLRPGQVTLTFAPASLPPAVVNTAYSATITASGGQAPYTFSAVGLVACRPHFVRCRHSGRDAHCSRNFRYPRSRDGREWRDRNGRLRPQQSAVRRWERTFSRPIL